MAIAALLGGAAPAQQLGRKDFQHLMDAAVSAGAATAQAGTRTICVQRELELPLDVSKQRTADTHQAGLPGLPILPPRSAQQDAGVEQAYAVALGPRAAVASETEIATIAAPYIPYSSKAIPARCAIDPHWASTGSAAEHVTRVRLSRPVLANGFAFVGQVTECSGLCGSGWLRVFRKDHGKWKQVAVRNLFIS